MNLVPLLSLLLCLLIKQTTGAAIFYDGEIGSNIVPELDRNAVEFRISSTTPKYSIIGNVSDPREDKNRYSYHLTSRHPNFVIIPKTGELLLIKKPSLKSYNIVVKATENGNPEKFRLVSIVVEVLDVEDNNYYLRGIESITGNDIDSDSYLTENVFPSWTRKKRSSEISTKRLQYNLKESDGFIVDSVVLQLDAKQDTSCGLVSFNHWIRVDEKCQVKVRTPWDYEKLDEFKTIAFEVEFHSKNNRGISAKVPIEIKVEDENDEFPYFVNTPLPMQTSVEPKAIPGTTIYKLQAIDNDSNSSLHYTLAKDSSSGLFSVDPQTGAVIRTGNGELKEGKEYVLHVKAEDRNGIVDSQKFQSTPEESLSILVGPRPPQFYSQDYTVTTTTNKRRGSDILQVKAKSFSNSEITYHLNGNEEALETFTIGSVNGIIKLMKTLKPQDGPTKYSFTVIASEDAGSLLNSSAEVIINVENREEAFSKLPYYQAHNVEEDIPVGSSILKLFSDSGENLQYSVDRDEFSIDENGTLLLNKPLDADIRNTYQMTVKVVDQSNPGNVKAGTVKIIAENKNDEPPTFTQPIYKANVFENANAQTLVATVVASDKDGDNIFYSFADGSTRKSVFQIDEKTGVVRLSNTMGSVTGDKYELEVIARDDGSCCKDGNNTIHESRVPLHVYIVDINNHKPEFPKCESYSAKISEGSPPETFVIQVEASDSDKGENAEIRYHLVTKPSETKSKFTIDPVTGVIRTLGPFDREGPRKYVPITVKAVDQGNPPLHGICNLKIDLTDINDNPPLFDRLEYRGSIKQDVPLGTQIFKLAATDDDADANGEIVYSLGHTGNRQDLQYFKIHPTTGWISVNKTLPKSNFHLKGIATDRGVPPLETSVDIFITVYNEDNNPPTWYQTTYGPIQVKENVEVGRILFSLRASSGIPGNPTIIYSVVNGNLDPVTKQEMFYLSHRAVLEGTWADLRVKSPLDYESTRQYNLTIRAENNGETPLASDATVLIAIDDVNDEIPYFEEPPHFSVLEGLPIGSPVGQLNAIDKDGTYPNNKVFYTVVHVDGLERPFSVNPETGEIFSRIEFDREAKKSYTLLITAYDGATSAVFKDPLGRPGKPNSITQYFRIEIEDKNDNSPYFDQDLYDTEVSEDEDLKQILITVTAKDKDENSKLKYFITRGNVNGVFGVHDTSGAIYLNAPLDYEERVKYKLRLSVSDGIHENHTTVIIRVKDTNDIPPSFEKILYETHIKEEDERDLPKKILQVKAVDGDKERPYGMVYFLSGQGVHSDESRSKFSINSTSGEIYVLQPVDRDPPHGRPEWRFMVFAEDEDGNGLINHADVIVHVEDINDNAPYFPDLNQVGYVTENGPAGLSIITSTALDHDSLESDGTKMRYTLLNHQNLFQIGEYTGLISTKVCCLDREEISEYLVNVLAVDGNEHRGTGTVTIRVRDVNDNPPKFTQSEYNVVVDETDEDNVPDETILTFQVSDKDLPESNRFVYRVMNTTTVSDRFTVVTNPDGSGSLKIIKPLDFEDPLQRHGIKIFVSVTDTGDSEGSPEHFDEARVNIKLQDINDNRPEFKKNYIEVRVPENVGMGATLAKFRATDVDFGDDSGITYAIERSSDKKRQFMIDSHGTVKVQRPLDREDIPRYHLKILAVDTGKPPKTGVATLMVVVGDVNDNPPRFMRDYRPIIEEHAPPQKVAEIFATDDDDRDKGNGGPFVFRMDPSASSTVRRAFELVYDPKGANGDGSAIIHSKEAFDREVEKEYLIPIAIKDNASPPLTSTCTLTVVVGDRNDNRMHAGSKTITIYNFKGESPPTIIGRVHVEDEDDWDLGDKAFFWADYNAHKHFDVDQTNGEIIMNVVQKGDYHLKFTVFDRKMTQEVPASVRVTVKDISEEAVLNSGSIRVSGITAEDVIRVWSWKEHKAEKSKYNRLKHILSQIFKTSDDDVDIFSVVTIQEKPAVTDIRFSINHSPTLKAEYLDGTVALNRDIIADATGMNIIMVGIDECATEGKPCDESCTNKIDIRHHPVTINANRTAFVGVNVRTRPLCICDDKDTSKHLTCRNSPSFCLNGGKCIDTSAGMQCKCPKGFDGPQCQSTTISFSNGQGWAWLPALKQCEESHLSVEIMTNVGDGLILYNGPLLRPDGGMEVAPDFISLELKSGNARVLIDYGSGTEELTVDAIEDLHNGAWHKIDVFWNRETVRLMIDNCEGGEPRKRCENSTRMPPFKELLNLNGPLQLGGIVLPIRKDLFLDSTFSWKYVPTKIGFTGCIKNLIHNSRMYDLFAPALTSGSVAGCQFTKGDCDALMKQGKCDQGYCHGSLKTTTCVCNPGWKGAACDQLTTSKLFLEQSFAKFSLTKPLDVYKNEIQLMFRTRQPQGELLRITNKEGNLYLILEIKDKQLRFRYSVDRKTPKNEQKLRLNDVEIDDGTWHHVKILRFGSAASIALDGGVGRKYAEINNFKDVDNLVEFDSSNIMLGGYEESGKVINGLNTSCIQDLRIDGRHIPFEQTPYSQLINYQNLEDGCSSNNPCKKASCPMPFTCADKWMTHECVR